VPKAERLAREQQRIKAEGLAGLGFEGLPLADGRESGGLRSSSHLSERGPGVLLPPHLAGAVASSSSSTSPFYPPQPPPGAGYPAQPPYPLASAPHPAGPYHPPHAAHPVYEADYSAIGHRGPLLPPAVSAEAAAAVVKAGREREEEEADLIGFVQLAHRDEQLFKRFMGLVSALPLRSGSHLPRYD
jgi:hypothetical protein